MAFTGHKWVDAPNGRAPELHMVGFSTTDDTVEVPTQLKVITGWSLDRQGTPGTTETLSLDETVSDFGEVVVPAGGFVTGRRAAHTTSGLIVSVKFWGR